MYGCLPAHLHFVSAGKPAGRVLTEEQQTSYYPAATLEGVATAGAKSMINWEKEFYYVNDAFVVTKAAVKSNEGLNNNQANALNYDNNNGNPPPNSIASGSYPSDYTVDDGGQSDKLYRVNGDANQTGLGMVLKVMAGDVVDVFGKSFYKTAVKKFDNSNSTVLTLSSLLNAFLGVPGSPATIKGITRPQLEGLNSGNYAIPNNFFRGGDGSSGNKPKAYINYIFFDEQFRYAGGGASLVSNSGSVYNHWNADAALRNISVPKNGYLYVYVSNESNINVYFDNLQVVHKRGPIVEETHYYPFGLTMAGISSNAVGFGTPNNKKKFIGQELASREFSDGAGLELYEFKFRNHDPQIGRFIQIDPLASEYVYNSTYAYAENKLGLGFDLEGLELFGINSPWVNVLLENNNVITRGPLLDALRKGPSQEALQNFQRGNKIEAEQLAKNNLAKNTEPIETIDPKTGEVGKTIPDAMKNDGQSTVEIKNVKSQSLTRQLRLQEKFSKDNGFAPELIINEGAKLSKPLKNSSFDISTYNISAMAVDATGRRPTIVETPEMKQKSNLKNFLEKHKDNLWMMGKFNPGVN